MMATDIVEQTWECNCTTTGLTGCPAHERCVFLPTSVWSIGPDKEVEILFVGQGGGSTEREQKLPFVGKAGKRLRAIVAAVWGHERPFGFAFSNTVRDCPPANRRPTETELSCCLPHLYSDINKLRTRGLKAVVLLGDSAKSAFDIPGLAGNIMSVHGTIVKKDNLLWMPELHPSFLCRMYTFPKGAQQDAMKGGPFDRAVIENISTLVRQIDKGV